MCRVFSDRSAISRRPNQLATAVAAAREDGRPLLDLTLSNPTVAGLPYPDAMLTALAAPAGRIYAPAPFGLPEARDAVGAELGVDPGHVVLTASTSEAYGLLFRLLCDPGDNALAPQPSYPLFDHLARLDAVTLRPYRLAWDGAWYVDRATLAPDARTRLVLAVNPNNPTGSYLDDDDLAALAAVGLPIVSDEVFSAYPLASAPHPSALSVADRTLVFRLGGLSKRAGLPQLKVGWIVVEGPAPWRDEALARLEVIADAYLSVATPTQHALPALLAAGRDVRNAILARTRENLATLRAAISPSSAATLLTPQGGWYAVLRVPTVRTEDEWVLALLARGVLVHPGWLFDFAHEAFLVLSLLPEPGVFADAVARLLTEVDAA